MASPQSSASNKVIVGMSGGVDSSVSALLLKEQGYEVEGLFMKNWDEDDGTEYCTAKRDLADAQAVCDKLGVPLHTANFAAEYWDNVFEYFLAEYKAGRTPNPDILCNREIKFKVFMQYAQMLGGSHIATGHYARTAEVGEHTHLLKGLDSNKDQSYFLHAVSGREFAKTLFPIGNIQKPLVRELAEKHHLVTHNKKDSTGICFIGERRFKDFLGQYLPAQPGNIVTEDGAIIGQHQGLMYHTIGQRQGLGIGGVAGAPEEPWYVAIKDLKANELVVVQGKYHPLLMANTLTTEACHWINPTTLEQPTLCCAKTRYRQPDQACTIEPCQTINYLGEPVDGLKVSFAEPQRAITPGQYAVFYEGERCLGGAIINAAT
ncbi:MAG TPA: tRNA 2-thiouridine(34) synthase MnmA [Marinagarivorans sp.]